MRASRVLVAGMRALSAEVCKNIVLAGVGEVVLCDHTVATKGDILGQFLISHDDIGKNVRSRQVVNSISCRLDACLVTKSIV
jgi:ubiquitin-like 1-activating enzyme E1 A